MHVVDEIAAIAIVEFSRLHSPSQFRVREYVSRSTPLSPLQLPEQSASTQPESLQTRPTPIQSGC